MNKDSETKAIRHIWNLNESNIRNHTGQLKEITKKETELTHQRRSTEIALTRAQQRAETIRSYIVLTEGPPQNIKKIHKQLLHLYRQSFREDITIRKKKEVDAQITALQQELQTTCFHSVVIEFYGYKGSHSDDYDDAYNELRICIICQHTDSRAVGYSPETEYKSLADKPERIIYRGERAPKTRKPLFDFWQPLSEIFPTLITTEMKELRKEIEQYISSQNPS